MVKFLRKDIWDTDKLDTVDIFPGLSQKDLLILTLIFNLRGSYRIIRVTMMEKFKQKQLRQRQKGNNQIVKGNLIVVSN